MINFILLGVEEVDKVRAFDTVEVADGRLWYAWFLYICKLMADARIVNTPADRGQLFPKLLRLDRRLHCVPQRTASLLVEELVLPVLLLAEVMATAGARRGCRPGRLEVPSMILNF